MPRSVRHLLVQRDAVVHLSEKRPVELLGAAPGRDVVQGHDDPPLALEENGGEAEAEMEGFGFPGTVDPRLKILVINARRAGGHLPDGAAQRTCGAVGAVPAAVRSVVPLHAVQENAAAFVPATAGFGEEELLRPLVRVKDAGIPVDDHHRHGGCGEDLFQIVVGDSEVGGALLDLALERNPAVAEQHDDNGEQSGEHQAGNAGGHVVADGIGGQPVRGGTDDHGVSFAEAEDRRFKPEVLVAGVPARGNFSVRRGRGREKTGLFAGGQFEQVGEQAFVWTGFPVHGDGRKGLQRDRDGDQPRLGLRDGRVEREEPGRLVGLGKETDGAGGGDEPAPERFLQGGDAGRVGAEVESQRVSVPVLRFDVEGRVKGGASLGGNPFALAVKLPDPEAVEPRASRVGLEAGGVVGCDGGEPEGGLNGVARIEQRGVISELLPGDGFAAAEQAAQGVELVADAVQLLPDRRRVLVGERGKRELAETAFTVADSPDGRDGQGQHHRGAQERLGVPEAPAGGRSQAGAPVDHREAAREQDEHENAE